MGQDQAVKVSRAELLGSLSSRLDKARQSDPGSTALRKTWSRDLARLQAVAGQDSEAMHHSIDASLARDWKLVGKSALATAGVAGLSGAAFCLGVEFPAVLLASGAVLGVPFMLAGLWGVVEQHQARAALDRWAPRASTPPQAWLPALPPLDPKLPVQRQEVQQLMESARDYLEGSADVPGHQAALKLVKKDLARLSPLSGLSVDEVRASIQASKKSHENRLALCMGGALVTGLAGMFLIMGGLPVLAPGLTAALVQVGIPWVAPGLAVYACAALPAWKALRHKLEQRKLDRFEQNLQGWEQQVQGLRAASNEVYQLTRPGSSSGVQNQGRFLVVGGVRIPVAS